MLLSGTAPAGEGGPQDGAGGVSEHDFFSELPIVLSVSRLAQPLDETPGAVTVIDRDMIRLSGARQVAELLRFVPGFQVSDSFEAAAPAVVYHGAFNAVDNQMQVLIDGRSVYASFIVGSVAPGLQTLAVEDIERIEVLRGSNSAAYGARAFLGVINIVTRDPDTTGGVRLVKRNGGNGIDDSYVRGGWAAGDARFRVSAGQRKDDGLEGASGGIRVRHLNLRADLRPGPADDLQLRAGASEQDAGVGFADLDRNAPRNRHFGFGYLQADWRRALGPDQDLAISLAHADERFADRFLFVDSGLFKDVPVDSGGVDSNDNIGVQHTFRSSDRLRVVWGGEWRREAVRSPPLYNADATLTTEFRRLYANGEWRLSPGLLLNAGGMYEDSSLSGSRLAPRLMLNWHLAPGQTLRVGASNADRPPSIFEKRADVDFVGHSPIPNGPVPVLVTIHSSGTVHAETLRTNEIGYLGEFRRIGLSADVRLFDERVGDGIGRRVVTDPRNFAPLPVVDFTNIDAFTIYGFEYQLQYRPRPGTRLIANPNFDPLTEPRPCVHWVLARFSP